MVVKYGSNSIFYTFYIGCVGGRSCSVQVKMAVYIPPHSVKNLIKVSRIISVYGKTSGKRAVYMRMGIYKCRHYQVSFGVYYFRMGIFQLKIKVAAYFYYFVSVNGNAAVFKIWVVNIPRNDFTVGYKIHTVSSSAYVINFFKILNKFYNII